MSNINELKALLEEFKLTKNSNWWKRGSSLVGEFNTSYSKLKDTFGKPNSIDAIDGQSSGDGKVSTQWLFVDDSNNFVTLYDYKETELYSDEYPSVEKFRSRSSYDWHVGASSKKVGDEFINWLKEKLG